MRELLKKYKPDNYIDENVALPFIWMFEKICKTFPRFNNWIESKMKVAPGEGTNSLGPL